MVPTLEIIKPSNEDIQNPLSHPVLRGIVKSSKGNVEQETSKNIQWKSEKDGDLGTGDCLTPYLSLGRHVITATITTQGTRLTKTISFWVRDEEPPIKLMNLVEFAWGLSINFSHDEHQRDIGTAIRNKALEIFGSYQKNSKYDKDGKLTEIPDKTSKEFFDNVILSMVKTVRNIGFTRNNHQNSLHSLSAEYKNTEEYYDGLASFTSFKDKGLAPKMLAFFGGGTGFIAAITDVFTKISPTSNKETIDALNTTINSINSPELVQKSNELLTKIKNTDTPSTETIDALNTTINSINSPELVQKSNELLTKLVSSESMPIEIAVILFGVVGVLSLGALNVTAYVLKEQTLKKKRKEILCKQRKYYIRKYRRNMALILMNFFNDAKKIAQKFYDNEYQEKIMKDDLSGIIIDEEEFKWMYEGTRFEHHWCEEKEGERTYSHVDENGNCEVESQTSRKGEGVKSCTEDPPDQFNTTKPNEGVQIRKTYRLLSDKITDKEYENNKSEDATSENNKPKDDKSEEMKLWYFISYKILPVVYAPMHPEQANA